MAINFLYPDPNKKRVLDELDKLVNILQKPKSVELTTNIRVLRNFTKSLFIISHKKAPKKPLHIQTHHPRKLVQPPLPPPPPAPVTTAPTPTTESTEEENTISQLKEEGGILKYDVVAPEMEEKDWEIYNTILPKIKENLKKDPEIKDSFLEKEIKTIAKEQKIKISKDYFKKIKYHLTRNLKGYGVIDPLIKDSRVKKIICDSFNKLQVVFNNKKLETNIKFKDTEELNNFIKNIAEKYDKEVSDSSPVLDLKIQNLEIKANYNPLTSSSFTITKL